MNGIVSDLVAMRELRAENHRIRQEFARVCDLLREQAEIEAEIEQLRRVVETTRHCISKHLGGCVYGCDEWDGPTLLKGTT